MRSQILFCNGELHPYVSIWEVCQGAPLQNTNSSGVIRWPPHNSLPSCQGTGPSHSTLILRMWLQKSKAALSSNFWDKIQYLKCKALGVCKRAHFWESRILEQLEVLMRLEAFPGCFKFLTVLNLNAFCTNFPPSKAAFVSAPVTGTAR